MENSLEANYDDLAIRESYNMMLNISEIIFHDFKNMLATISGLAQLSLLNAQTEEVKKNLKSITKATFDLRDSLNRYYKFTQGVSDEHDSVCTLYKILSDTLDLLQFKIDTIGFDKKINLMLNINSNGRVNVNEYEIKQSLINIIMNSLEAMEGTGGTLQIDLHDDDNNIYLDIIDSGVGISKENLSKLFKETFTTKENGTGIGLKLAKNSIEKSGGSLDIFSELGIGTIVNISFPIFKE